jgi:hypothetical protein
LCFSAIVGLLFAAWHAASLLKIPIATFGMDGGERSTTIWKERERDRT